jgi:acyl transferase domain-containing protein/thioesterase domain-containing protein/acyl carrier protein
MTIQRDEGIGSSDSDVAIVGLACRFPGASDADGFWRNLRDGVESVRPVSDDELRASGVSESLIADPNYVKMCAPLEGMAAFDAEFFGLSPRDAAIMDPQHRHFLECSWEALENAGHPPASFDGSIGVYAGCGMNAYMMFNLLTNPELMESVGLFLLRHTGNDKDFLSTRVSFELNLRGPSVNVQTACSTSLVALHMASQSLISGECDMALAGGATIEQPHHRGYLYVEGEILSPDGHCRPFDHRSQGTVFGSGLGVVVLRRLEDAVADGDHIYAVVKGSAINNDGSDKAGYLAPSVDGQAGAISEALEVCGFSADTIDYVEAHGTGTPIGDPIEVAALSEAFRATTERQGFCGIGSLKGNIGHLDTAAGVASVIKVAQSLRHGQLAPSLNFEAPNPACAFEGSPFFVNAELRAWPRSDSPRRAGISSLGVGGTNAHVVLEEAPERPQSGTSRAFQMLTLSARNPDALDAAGRRLADYLRSEPDANLADVAYTLHCGRDDFALRRSLVCRDVEHAVELLEGAEPQRVRTQRVDGDEHSVAFMFPGGGAQYPRMGLDLYESEAVFRQHVDRGLALLRERGGIDLRPLLFVDEEGRESAAAQLTRPSLQLPALFIIEYALAQLWMSWGMQPSALIGHSMGENTAACVAGVMSFEDCLGLVTLRGRLFESVPKGGMLSVPLSPEELAPLLGDQLSLASVNAPTLCVASGPELALLELEQTLRDEEIEAQRIKIDIAAHSEMLDPILDEFGAYLRGIRLSPPTIPFVSNRTGTWIRDEEATDPEYWVQHLRGTVRFAEGVGALFENPAAVLLEVGPGKTLSSLARMNAPGRAAHASMRHPDEQASDAAFLLDVLGRLWTEGIPVDWQEFYGGEQRLRVPLPSYAFQRQEYWIAPRQARFATDTDTDSEKRIEKIPDISDWFFRPAWSDAGRAEPAAAADSNWLVFLDPLGVGARLAERLRDAGARVLTVREGDAYYRVTDTEYVLAPEGGRRGYDALLDDLAASDAQPDRIVHLWSLTPDRSARPGSSFYHHVQERGFFSLTFLAQALGDHVGEGETQLSVITNGSLEVEGEPLEHPEKATLAGPCKVIPQEFPSLRCTQVDVALPSRASSRRRGRRSAALDALSQELFVEVLQHDGNGTVALRGERRLTRTFERTRIEAGGGSRLKDEGVYLITGGLGGLGVVLAEHLARTRRAKLVLVGRSAVPERAGWQDWLDEHGLRDRTSRRLAKLLELERLGGEVLAVSADVANLEQMRGVVSGALERFGRIDGVFHAAGILDDDLIQVKTQTAIERVFAPKIQGALVLDELVSDPAIGVDFVALFSSTSALLGAAGQVDYVAANAFLDAFAHARRAQPGPSWLALDWGVWSDVGMGAEAALRRSGAANHEPSSEQCIPVDHPLLQSRHDGDDSVSFEADYAPATHWILDQHRTRVGQALVPGTAYVELARAAFAEANDGPVEIRDLFFLEPLQVDDGEVSRIRVELTREGDVASLAVASRQVTGFESDWRENATGQVAAGEFGPAEPLELAAIRARCSASHTPRDEAGIRTRQEAEHLDFGARWRCLNEVWWGDGEALAELSLPAPFADELTTFALHPALLDLATGYALDLVPGYDTSDRLFVPFSYGRVRLHHALTPRIYSHVRSAEDNDAANELVAFDVTLCDEQGRVLVEIERFTVKRIEDRSAFEGARASALPAVDSRRGGLSPAERAFLRTLEAGILREEGIEALERVLDAAPGSQTIVSSIEPDTLIAQVRDAVPEAAASGEKFSRPSLANEYVAPRDEIEAELVELWEELLGVDRVGVEDDFFGLGGHSLIAVRLFVQIKLRLGVDRPISVLYDAPTIASLAEIVREERGEGSGGGSKAKGPNFRFLVPMHSVEGTSKRPFFLVAGMFGNVLNLRHLADLIGTDRPFYAIQARGLYGDDPPHESFEEMASDYLDELRRVQPEGPYLIGGFSGGGIAAYEMTQQLAAAGQRVSALVLLDTPTARPPDSLTFRDKLQIFLQRLNQRGLRYFSEWLRARIQWEIERRRSEHEAISQSYEFRSASIEAAFCRALERYDTDTYAGAVHLFRPALPIANRLGNGRDVNESREFVYADNSWGRYLEGPFDVVEVPGDHDSMVLEPNVRVLAEALRDRLAAADEKN